MGARRQARGRVHAGTAGYIPRPALPLPRLATPTPPPSNATLPTQSKLSKLHGALATEDVFRFPPPLCMAHDSFGEVLEVRGRDSELRRAWLQLWELKASTVGPGDGRSEAVALRRCDVVFFLAVPRRGCVRLGGAGAHSERAIARPRQERAEPYMFSFRGDEGCDDVAVAHSVLLHSKPSILVCGSRLAGLCVQGRRLPDGK